MVAPRRATAAPHGSPRPAGGCPCYLSCPRRPAARPGTGCPPSPSAAPQSDPPPGCVAAAVTWWPWHCHWHQAEHGRSSSHQRRAEHRRSSSHQCCAEHRLASRSPPEAGSRGAAPGRRLGFPSLLPPSPPPHGSAHRKPPSPRQCLTPSSPCTPSRQEWGWRGPSPMAWSCRTPRPTLWGLRTPSPGAWRGLGPPDPHTETKPVGLRIASLGHPPPARLRVLGIPWPHAEGPQPPKSPAGTPKSPQDLSPGSVSTSRVLRSPQFHNTEQGDPTSEGLRTPRCGAQDIKVWG